MMTEEKSEYPIKIVEVFHQTDAAGNEVVTAVTVDSFDPEKSQGGRHALHHPGT